MRVAGRSVVHHNHRCRAVAAAWLPSSACPVDGCIADARDMATPQFGLSKSVWGGQTVAVT
jgi:hypothetical protein